MARTTVLAMGAFLLACDSPQTLVVFDNAYADHVVVRAVWLNDALAEPLAAKSSSDPIASAFASSNKAYAVVAPAADPSALVVLESRAGYELHIGETLHIAIGDDAFAGNCAAGSHLDRDEADFLVANVFPDLFPGVLYDASTCRAR